jgi:superfamily I DNA and/or RNA helicase/very-short-patch-repair endonuclease
MNEYFKVVVVMDTKRLDTWIESLLDIGKRNKLINYRDTRQSTVEIVYPEFSIFFHKITDSNIFEVYDAKINDLNEYYFEDDNDKNDEDQEEVKFKSKEEYINFYKNKIKKKSEILLYNSSMKPLASLRNIMKKGNSAIEETGVNVIYLAVGFIHWTESENSNYIFRAPILLIPIKIENQAINEPFYISTLEDEVVVNPTFSFKLKNDFGINLPDYNDEEIDDYLDSIGLLVKRMNWKVTKEAKISSFSFLKINMYNDIKSNKDKICMNDNVRILLGESNDNYSLSCDNDHSSYEIVDLYSVVDADSSQIEAIKLAKHGKSFVLQGPPGTGKSQTITNIISECLHDGKKVLFVSEKLAALNVVFNKLKQNDLSDFCLELHSHKANKKDIIEELNRTLYLDSTQVNKKAKDVIEGKIKNIEKLNSYDRELHLKRDIIDMSFFEIMNKISKNKQNINIKFCLKNIERKDKNYLETANRILEDYADFTDTIGQNYRKNVWYGLDNFDNTLSNKLDFNKNLNQIEEQLTKLFSCCEGIKDKYEISIEYLSDISSFVKLIDLLWKSIYIAPKTLNKSNYKFITDNIGEMNRLSRIVIENESLINLKYNAGIYEIDSINYGNLLKNKFYNSVARLFSKKYKEIKHEIHSYQKNGKKISYIDLLLVTEQVNLYKTNLNKFNILDKNYASSLNIAYKGLKTDWNELSKELEQLERLLNSCSLGNIINNSIKEFNNEKKNYKILQSSIENSISIINDNIVFKDYFDNQIIDLEKIRLSDLFSIVDKYIRNFEYLDNWCSFLKVLKNLHKKGLIEYIDYVIEEKIEKEKIVPLFNQIYYTQWADAIIQQAPILSELDRNNHDRIVKEFSEKDKLHFEINKLRIKEKLSLERPDLNMISTGSSVAIILREAQKKRKQKPIRNLLAENMELVQKIKPCFLMSPLSISTFLSPKLNFDVVIFDEASQIFPQDALGAVYRGKQIIVVGDTKQMPPSNFFTSSTESDSNDEEEDVRDFESILDLCSTAFNQLRLRWHYRSKQEQLIAFSNKNFYNNGLITFPSSKADAKGIGIDYYYVDGLYDRVGKNNIKEAEHIVELIYENFQKYPQRSLGVVAFSISQQSLIEKLLFIERQKNSCFEKLFSAEKNEPFFIKNLETVQGDERDTIIFSIGYGKDSQGRLLHNFGPINRNGGERRLNVAVTRAKYNVQLVSSIHHYDIDLARTQAKGTQLLKEYLDYAENGHIALERTMSVNPFVQLDSEFEVEVYEFLKEEGFSVDTQVGCSSFRIDLGIKKPNSSDYVLAIECDGASYHSSKNARDRDRLRQEILENMGWKFYRIWSTDWFRNNRVEKAKLLEAVNEATNYTSVDKPIDLEKKN